VLIAGNWKLNKGPAETDEFCRALKARLAGLDGVDVAVCPPFVSLEAAVRALAETDIAVLAQNVHWAEDGAYTGEVAPRMLAEIGVYGSLVGHSERRYLFGETLDERERGETPAVLDRQIKDGLDRIVAEQLAELVIAYEPVWAIGTGRTATPELAQDAHAFIKSLLDRPVLYGGSVKPENAAELMAQPDVDGALVGGASLEVESFVAICEAAAGSRS